MEPFRQLVFAGKCTLLLNYFVLFLAITLRLSQRLKAIPLEKVPKFLRTQFFYHFLRSQPLRHRPNLINSIMKYVMPRFGKRRDFFNTMLPKVRPHFKLHNLEIGLNFGDGVQSLIPTGTFIHLLYLAQLHQNFNSSLPNTSLLDYGGPSKIICLYGGIQIQRFGWVSSNQLESRDAAHCRDMSVHILERGVQVYLHCDCCAVGQSHSYGCHLFGFVWLEDEVFTGFSLFDEFGFFGDHWS